MIVEDVLQAAGVDYNVSRSNKLEVTICCPFCTDRNLPSDESYHLGININAGLAHCFRCGWKMRGVIPLARELCRVYGIPLPTLRPAAQVEKPKLQVVTEQALLALPEGFERFTNSPDRIEQLARKYLRARNVSQLQISRHHMGYAAVGDLAWRVIFPVYSDEGVVGWVARTFAYSKPKYLNSRGIKGLWNAQRYARTAVVVEGVMDALRVETALLSVRDTVAVARLGSVITPLQLSLLKQYENVVVFPDADKAGVQGAMELCERCDGTGVSVGVVVPSAMTGRDPGSMSPDEILDALRGAKRYNADVRNRLRAVAAKEQTGDFLS